MRYLLVILGGAILAVVAMTPSAMAQSPGHKISHGIEKIARGVQSRVDQGIGHARNHHSGHHRRWNPGPYPYQPYGYGYGYDGYGWGGYSPYPYYPPYYQPYGYPYIAPLTIPAETLYGPQAMMRFMGVDTWAAPRANLNVIVVAKGQNAAAAGGIAGQPPVQPGQPPAQPGQAPPQPSPPAAPPAAAAQPPTAGPTNQQAVASAWKFIGYGDAHFNAQKYADANTRYRKATRAAPQLADAWLRQGFAMTAMHRYDLAARSFKRGLALNPAWPKSAFRLDELYETNNLAKTAHIDALADAAVNAPTDSDLLFIVGVFLHFDGQQNRAKPFFQRARQMVGADTAYIDAFLK